MTKTTDGQELTPEMEQMIVKALKRIADGTVCVHCGQDVEHFRQVGRSYVAEPCEHRQGQGSAAYFNEKIAAKHARQEQQP